MHKIILTSLLLLFLSSLGHAESFIFGNNANGLTGAANTSLAKGVFQMSLTAGPTGAVLDESDDDGLGIDTSAIANVTDGGSVGDTSKFNIIDGTAPVSGQGEFISFSFDQPGILKELLFDGLKDETLEFYSIEFPDSSVISFFDFETEFRLQQDVQAVNYLLSDLGVPNPTEGLDSSDDLTGLNYVFDAGEVFTLTYGEIDYVSVLPGYDPVGSAKSGNGARFEGVTVIAIPEPSALLLFLAASSFYCVARNRCMS